MLQKKLVSFSFDMDNLDVIAKCYNFKISDDDILRNFYHTAGRRLLKLLSEFNLNATFFIIGKDLEMSDSRDFIYYAKSQGHELGNHTHNHVELTRLNNLNQKRELTLCHQSIKKYVGVEPKGFRGGSMHVTKTILEQMQSLGYKYNSSSYPTFLNLFFFGYLYLSTFNTRNIPRWRHVMAGFQRKEPFLADYGTGSSLVHIPTTVVPFCQLPFYATFHLLNPKLFEKTYPIVFKFRKNAVYQGHILDFVDLKTDGVPSRFQKYPLFEVPLQNRIRIYRNIIRTLIRQYEPVTLFHMSQKINFGGDSCGNQSKRC